MGSDEEFSLEWEERKENVPFKVHMVAGSLAGLIEHLLLLPIDNVKTHLQTTTSTVRKAVREISFKGLRNFYAGGAVVSVGCVPSHALFFLNYEYLRRWLAVGDQLNLLGNMLMGGASALCHDLIMTPCDMIKQRIQLTGASYRLVVGEAFRSEGLRSFWRSFPVNFFTNIPAAVVTVTSNENLKVLYRKQFGEMGAAAYFLCAGLAGAVSACATTPLDNIRTRLNTQVFHQQDLRVMLQAVKGLAPAGAARRPPGGLHVQRAYAQRSAASLDFCDCNPLAPQNKALPPCRLKYPDAWCAVRIILKEEGRRGFFKGLLPRACNHSFSTGISWMCYETIKNRLVSGKIF